MAMAKRLETGANILGGLFLLGSLWWWWQQRQRQATQMPVVDGLDNTLAWMLHPYTFIARHSQQLNTSCFQTQLLGQNTICLRGESAARLFYDENRFLREGAHLLMAQNTLLGKTTIQNKDDAEHWHRKGLWMTLLSPERTETLKQRVALQWQTDVQLWQQSAKKVVLYQAVQTLLGKAVCGWVGLSLDSRDKRLRDLVALFDQAASWRHFNTVAARKRLETWLEMLIKHIRQQDVVIPEDTPLSLIVWYRDFNGQLLPPRDAAGELLNLIRPVMAVSVYMVQLAHALHTQPVDHNRMRIDPEYQLAFVQEVRRFYPFFPPLMARVRQDFEWHGFRFTRGTRVLLDLHGTNTDPRSWQAPDQFNPDRFLTWEANPYDFIPQGGGDTRTGHRCPGESLTIELMQQALNMLLNHLQYEVPAQDLTLQWSRLPAIPKSRFIIKQVKVINQPANITVS